MKNRYVERLTASAWRHEHHGQTHPGRQTLEPHRAPSASTEAEALSTSRSQAGRRPGRADRHPLCSQDRHPLGRPATGDGVWLRHDLLAATARLAGDGRMENPTPRDAGPTQWRRPSRLVTSGDRQCQCARCFWGAKTGPNPTDRRKLGSKHHLVTDAGGIPLATSLTGANRHDVTQLIPLVDDIGPVAGKPGRPRQRPDSIYADRAYDSNPHRRQLEDRGIEPVIPRRRTAHGSGLGVHRWVSRTLALLAASVSPPARALRTTRRHP